MDSSGATPISLTGDSCAVNENRCHIATPAPQTPFPYSPLSPYAPINPYSFMSRYSGATAAAAHLQSAFSSPLANSYAAGLAYPPDMFHYNPYSALTPTSPLTPSSFWSLTAQQSYHQMNGITFGPTGPVSYNTNAHLYNLFSPNSLSPMSPSPDSYSSLYPRVSSLPSPYATSPGLSSAFMSPSSMPLLLSPSLTSSVDRPPTYLSDNTSTPSTTASMTPSIKCEPTEQNCTPQQTSHTIKTNFNDNSFDKNNSNERHVEKVDKNITINEKTTEKRPKHNENNSNKQSLKTQSVMDSKQESQQHRESLLKTITTTITTSIPTKTKEKHSARVEPLMRIEETIDTVARNGNSHGELNNHVSELCDKTICNDKTCESTTTTTVDTTISTESRHKEDIIVENDLRLINAKVKRELIECDMSLPLNSVKSVPNCNQISGKSNAIDVIANNTNNNTELNPKPKPKHNSIDIRIDDKFDDKNLVIENGSNSSNSNSSSSCSGSSSDGRDVLIINTSSNSNSNESNLSSKSIKRSKDAKRESQLKQLQSYRKESHRVLNSKPKTNDTESSLKGLQSHTSNTSNAAISIVLPKPNNQINGEHKKPLNDKLVNQSSNSANQSIIPLATNAVPNKTSATVKSTLSVIPVVDAIPSPTHPKTQTVIPCRTKAMHKITTNANSGANQTQQLQQSKQQSINSRKLDTNCLNETSNQLAINAQKTAQNNANSATKQLPKKPRMSRKPTSATIPVGIAIAQQRTSPKTKSPTDSATNASQPLKPILPTLSLPVMTNSPILITDSPPAGTSLWIKPTANSALNTNNSMQTNSQFSLTGDYQLARDSLTGHLYLIRNSSSLPTTPTGPPKPTIIPSLTIKNSEHQSKSSPSTIITLPVGAAQPQQFFASLGQTQASTLILDTTNSAPIVQIAATAPVTRVMNCINSSALTTTLSNSNHNKNSRHLSSKDKNLINANNINNNINNSSVNVERGCQASISDDELTCDNMKTTSTQVDMDEIHLSEEDEDNEGKRHKLRLFEERKHKSSERTSSVEAEDEDESSRDSIHLQIVDESATDEPPQLPVKSAPVMQFIDHHGLDLLVDSIEEFAAREESSPSTAHPSTDLPVNGLQLLSTLAEQRSREERLGNDACGLRRHSADSSVPTNGQNIHKVINDDCIALKKRQRSESCFTTNPNKYDENEELLSDIKKLMKTSSCQTELLDRRSKPFIGKSNEEFNNFANLRRSERIFINDSVVSNATVNCSNTKDVNNVINAINTNTNNTNAIDVSTKDKDLLISKEFKRKESFDIKFKSIPNNNNNNLKVFNEKNVLTDESTKTNSSKPKDHYVFIGSKSDELVLNPIKPIIIDNKPKTDDKTGFCDNNNTNNQRIISESSDSTKDKFIGERKDKKKKLSSISGSFSSSFSSNTCDTISGDKKVKKRKKKPPEVEQKKKLKTDYDKQIDESIESIIKRVSQIDDSIDESPLNAIDSVDKKTIAEKQVISEDVKKSNENKESVESDGLKKRKPFVDPSFELYDQKRMKLLDETIDEIIAKQLVPIESQEQTIELKDKQTISPKVEDKIKTTTTPEPKSTPIESSAPIPSEQPPIPEPPKLKTLVKQSSNCSTTSSISSSITSVSDSCQSSAQTLNLKLTETDLDLKLNVIMLVDGLLYVGEICPIQAPDIYGIILHGERQHRPIIYSQEEMLKEAIREIKPSLVELEEGQRVCAYWSTQYRHLYPGYVRSSSPHPNLVFVEFDDGDNGRISVDDIRLLPQEYPQMKINADPLKNLERRRRMSSSGKDSRNAKHNSDNSNSIKVEDKKCLNEENVCNSLHSKTKSNEESIISSANDLHKKDSNVNLKTKSNKSSNTSTNGKVSATHESTNDNLSLKLDLKKKKKKHNKEDRHHRHHHNHKRHHCRHHRNCRKHKKSKYGETNSIASSSSNTSLWSVCKDYCPNTNQIIEKSSENVSKSTKPIASKVNSNSSKDDKEVQKRDSDAQRALANNRDNSNANTVNTTDDNNKLREKTELKTVIKKTPKQRALDRLQTNLSEKFSTISSPVRKRYTTDPNKTTSASAPTPKKRERMPSNEKSKIAAFLPERQLWHWSGKYIRRTGNKGSRTRKVYYKEIERGREHIRVDDCAVFLSTGRPHLPYIGRIDSMWQTGSGTMIVKVRWFYHPEETKGEAVPLADKRGALFESSHFDVNDVQTISHKCQVISWNEYQEKRRENPMLGLGDDPPNVYYLAGQYDALGGCVEMDSSVPLKDKPKEDKTALKTA